MSNLFKKKEDNYTSTCTFFLCYLLNSIDYRVVGFKVQPKRQVCIFHLLS